ncbi:MAG: FadR family transcriptional regulator [Gemmatimonadaceae bacterium]|nr:FadR family transcriptional regulator [Gemmatimonadaceae bacterium]
MNSPLLDTVPRRRAVTDVIAALERAIGDGRWAVGARLPTEPELMTLLGVGRSTVREAVQALAHSGVLEVRQGAGTFVRARLGANGLLARELRHAALRDVYEVRRLLELDIARLACARRTPDDLAALRATVAARNLPRTPAMRQAFVAADVAFHEAVAAATHNGVLIALYRTFTAALGDALASEIGDATLPTRDTHPQHVALVDAIEARDAERAVAAIADILDGMLAALPSHDEPAPRGAAP